MRCVQVRTKMCDTGVDPILGFFRTFRAHQYGEIQSNERRKRIGGFFSHGEARLEETLSLAASSRHSYPIV